MITNLIVNIQIQLIPLLIRKETILFNTKFREKNKYLEGRILIYTHES